MTDSKNDSITGASLAKVLGESKHWPVIANGMEVGIECIRKNAVVYELSAHNDVLICLIGC